MQETIRISIQELNRDILTLENMGYSWEDIRAALASINLHLPESYDPNFQPSDYSNTAPMIQQGFSEVFGGGGRLQWVY